MNKKYLLPFFLSLAFVIILTGCGSTATAPSIQPPKDEPSSSSTNTELSLNVTKNGTPYIGSTLAGTTSPLLNFTPEDYQKAQTDKKNILLIFCNQNDTVCLTEMQNAIGAFNQITSSNIIGFSLKYNASDATPAEKQITSQYKVTSEPTKILINAKGEKLVQTTDNWNAEQYLEQLNQLQ